jgi:CBS domain-containing protein
MAWTLHAGLRSRKGLRKPSSYIDLDALWACPHRYPRSLVMSTPVPPAHDDFHVGALCRRSPVTIDQHARLSETARRMHEAHVGALVVTAEQPQGRAVIGVVTDRDLVLRVLSDTHSSSLPDEIGELVGERMVGIDAHGTLSNAIALMEQEGVRRLLVQGREGELVGVLSLDDVVDALAVDLARLSRALRKGREHEGAAPAAAPQPALKVPRFGTAAPSFAGWKSAA